MERKPKRRLFGLLRRIAQPLTPGTAARRTPQDEHALWQSHARVLTRSREAGEAAQRLSSAVSRQRGAIDIATERTRIVAGRGQELGAAVGRVVDTFERLSLVALNAGLEGARLGEGPGRALLLVAEEVRSHATRGAEAARELSTALDELGGEWVHVSTQLAAARELSADVAQEAARTSGACAEVERAVAELEDRLRATSTSDPETVRAMAEVTEHVRALGAAMDTLRGRVPREVLADALRPALEPLAAAFDETEGDGGAGPS